MSAIRFPALFLLASLPFALNGQTAEEAYSGHTLGGMVVTVAPTASRHDALIDFEHRFLAIAWRDRFAQMGERFEAEGRAYLLNMFWMHCDSQGVALPDDEPALGVGKVELADGIRAWLVTLPQPAGDGEALCALLLHDGRSPRYFLLERAGSGGATSWIVTEWVGKLDDGELSMHVKYGACDDAEAFIARVGRMVAE